MCNPLKLYGDVGLCNGFHAVNSGSNPLGDAKDFKGLYSPFVTEVCWLQSSGYRMPHGVPSRGAFLVSSASSLTALSRYP